MFASFLAGLFLTACQSRGLAGSPLAPTMRPIVAVAGQAPVVLVAQGQPRVTVVIPDERGKDILMNYGKPFKEDVCELAAQELVRHVALITGAKLPVVKARDFTGGPAVYLGVSAAAAKAGFLPDDSLPPEGFSVVVKDGSLAIIGPDREKYYVTGANGQPVHEPEIDSTGTLFGVYDVLERFLGVRWYWPTDELGTIAPRAAGLAVPAVSYADWPLYQFRSLWPEGANPAHWADVGPNPRLFYKRWRYGMGSAFFSGHSYGRWGELYATRHPEYFQLRKDGQREFKYYCGQLCFSESGVLRQEIENLKNFYAKGDLSPWGTSIFPHQSFIPIMPNDCNGHCWCAACREANAGRRNPDPEGSETELIHNYWIKVANAVRQLWPEKYVMFCAYSNYLLPPESIEKYPDNMIAELCMQVGTVMFKEPAKRQYWQDMIDAYYRKTGRPVTIWSYSNLPQMCTRAPINAPNVIARFRRDNRDKIAGEFIDHEAGKNRTFALDHLNLYFWLKTMWNPDLDVRAALDEYYRLCYGPAEPAMKAFYDLLIERWEKVVWNLPGPSGSFPLDKVYTETYPPEIRARLQTLLAEARQLAPDGSDYARRVAYVTAGHRGFFEEGATFEKLGDGTVATAVAGTPKLDGQLDDPCWRGAGTRLVETATGNAVPTDSRVWFAYDDHAIYLAARLAEPDMPGVQAKAQQRDDAAWADDSIEFFLCATENLEAYVQIAINTNGVIFDGAKESNALFNEGKNFAIEQRIVKRADGWDIEVRIPWSELGVSGVTSGTKRRANLIKNGHVGGFDRGQAFSPTLGQSNHNTRFFGTLQFE